MVYTSVVGAAMSFVAFLLVTESHNLLWIFGVIIVSVTLLCSLGGAYAVHAKKKKNKAKVHCPYRTRVNHEVFKSCACTKTKAIKKGQIKLQTHLTFVALFINSKRVLKLLLQVLDLP